MCGDQSNWGSVRRVIQVPLMLFHVKRGHCDHNVLLRRGPRCCNPEEGAARLVWGSSAVPTGMASSDQTLCRSRDVEHYAIYI
jgi:hypothetical protein